MRTIIHIGQHKTGTTSIQHFLARHRTDLIKQGLYIPDSLLGSTDPSHYLLNVYALNENRSSTAKIRLIEANGPDFINVLRANTVKEITRHYEAARKLDCREIIWTNEGLYLLNSVEEYKRLYELFKPWSSDLVCICCLRDVDSYRRSYMAQLARNGLSFSNDKDSYLYVEPDSWLFDYSRKESLLRTVFDNIILFPYNRTMVKTFMEKIGYIITDDNKPVRQDDE